MIVPHKMVGLERMLDYGGVGVQRFHCTIHEDYCVLPSFLQVDRIAKERQK